MTIKEQIQDYTAAHPNASAKQVALACDCSQKTVYNCWTQKKSAKVETIKDRVLAYRKANPSADFNEIAKANNTSYPYVLQVINGRKKKPKMPTDAKPIGDVKILSKREREIKVLLETESVLLRRIKRLTDDNHLYAERELKLKGVIDYLEAKVEDGLAI